MSVEPGAATRTAGAFAFPVFVEVRDRVVLVAGDGAEARHKAAPLPSWARWCGAGRPPTGLEPALLDDALLAIVNTGDRVLDRQIAADARSRWCWSTPSMTSRLATGARPRSCGGAI